MAQQDAAWRDNLVFSEYFHGDNGAGLGASHQTGWTGLVARPYRRLAAASMPDVTTAREARGVTGARLPRPGQPRR